MKLRIVFISILALALMAPAALASDTTDGTTGDDSATNVEDGTNDDSGTAKGKAKPKKVKKYGMNHLCGPRKAVVTYGELASVNVADSEVRVKVDKANRHGKRFVGGEATFKLWKKVKFRVKTDKVRRVTLDELATALAETPGLRVKVIGRGCMKELKDDSATPELIAKLVKAKAPVAEAENADGTEQQTDGADAQDGDGTADTA